MTVSPELGLLDDLLGGPIRLVDAASWRFDGYQSRMLRSVQKMRADGPLRIIEDGSDVADWRVTDWVRQPGDDAVRIEIGRVVVAITDDGVGLVG